MNKYIIHTLLLAGFVSLGTVSARSGQPAADSAHVQAPAGPEMLFGTSSARTTGAISSVGGETLRKTTATNLTNSFAGEFAGMTLFQGSGEPSNDMASWLIRGIGSYGNANYNSAKIFVDGFEVNASYIAYLSPAEIERVSVLKDGAALAIFGERGANGVIWIETKRGQVGPVKVSASVRYGVQQATTMAKPLDS